MARLGLCALLACLACPRVTWGTDAAPWSVGVAKVEITPTEPVRLSGYGGRTSPLEGVADPLFARAVAIRYTGGSEAREREEENAAAKTPLVLLSIDSIGTGASLTREVAEAVEQRHGIPRAAIVLCSTHSHSAPHLDGTLPNLFRTPLSDEEAAATARYTRWLRDQLIAVVDEAIERMEPARLRRGEGIGNVAVNRRQMRGSVVEGIGIQEDGAVDHSIPILEITAADGTPRGIVYGYACHGTTVGPDFNQVSGDWMGLSAAQLEKSTPGLIALPVIGCGADANPNPRGTYEMAQLHGIQIADSVRAALAEELSPIDAPPRAAFGYAGLAPERPSREQLEEWAASDDPYRVRFANHWIEVLKRMGRIPETYPAPLHTWRFGDQLTWVFLGGEVVVDYQLRLRRDLPGQNVWVTAYTDDVFAYVASERMRAEGGYEVDHSMIYYMQPGRWQSGTEDLIVSRIEDLLAEEQPEDRLLDPEEARGTLQVPDGWTVDLVAAEPLVDDPINLAFGVDGRLWVVEMRDYPEGVVDESGEGGGPGGVVKYLEDVNGDGRMDRATVFLEGLSYPTGVYPWRDGVVVACAPEIFYAADTTGDGRADVRETLVDGFALANPQHRVSGFTYGLDHRLYLGTGASTRQVELPRAGGSLEVGGRDLALDPDTGQLATVAGATQFIRSRDDFDRWIGNSNSLPGFHYVIEPEQVERSGRSLDALRHQLFDPPTAPPVFPASRTIDRFNDLFALNRFTSACSTIVARSAALGADFDGALLVCEPVHNLVHRSSLVAQGATMRARRVESEEASEWLRSTDPWFRPVRVENGPDGAIWVVDMYRQVIEHPQWIPEEWQQRLDVRRGEGRGRIYRVRRLSGENATEEAPAALPRLSDLSTEALVERLGSPHGAQRDLAQQRLLWRDEAQTAELIRAAVARWSYPPARLQAVATLRAGGWIGSEDWLRAIDDPDPRVAAAVIGWIESHLDDASLRGAVIARAEGWDVPAPLALQVILALSGREESEAGEAVARLVAEHLADPWIRRAALLAQPATRLQTTQAAIERLRAAEATGGEATDPYGAPDALTAWLAQMIEQAAPQEELTAWVAQRLGDRPEAESIEPWRVLLVAAWVAHSTTARDEFPAEIQRVLEHARRLLADPSEPTPLRLAATSLLGSGGAGEEDLQAAADLLAPQQPPALQHAAIERIAAVAEERTGEILLANWSGHTPAVRSRITATLLTRANWTEQLLAAMERGEVLPAQLDAAAIQSLRSGRNPSLQARSEAILGRPSEQGRDELIDRYAAQLPPSEADSPGELAASIDRGEQLFTRHCATCHLGRDGETPVGAALENLGHWTERAWLEAILDPNRAIDPRYRQYQILTEDGQILVGVILEESSREITMADASGTRHSVSRERIQSQRDTGVSLMPEGFEEQLNPAEMRDLLRYLRSRP